MPNPNNSPIPTLSAANIALTRAIKELQHKPKSPINRKPRSNKQATKLALKFITKRLRSHHRIIGKITT